MNDPKIIESATIVLHMSDGTTQTIEFHKGGSFEAAIEHKNDLEPASPALPPLRRVPHVDRQRFRFELEVVADRYSDYSASDGNIYTTTDSALAGEASS